MPRAVRFDRYGDRDVLYIADVEIPDPPAGEVVVEVRAAGINPGEAAIRSGALARRFPRRSRRVRAATSPASCTPSARASATFAVGDEVLGWSWQRSSQAEYVSVPVDQLIAKPPELSFEVAGSLYVVAAPPTRRCGRSARRRATRSPSRLLRAASARSSSSCSGRGARRPRASRRSGTTSGSPRTAAVPVAYGDGLLDRLRAAAPDGIDAFIDLFGPEYVELADRAGRRARSHRHDHRLREGGRGRCEERGQLGRHLDEVLAEMAGLVASGRIEIPIAATLPPRAGARGLRPARATAHARQDRAAAVAAGTGRR